jgi:recombination protein RecA
MSSAVFDAPLPSPLLPLETPFREPGRSRLLELPRGVVPGSQLEVRPAPATVPTGIASIDALTSGLPRGALSEIFGPASSGRTSMILAALADATRRQEVCALVDAGDSLHPESTAAAGMDLQRLLWIRCGENPPRRHGSTEEIDDLKIDDCRLKNQQPADHESLTSSPRMNADERGSGSIRNLQSGQNSKLETRNYTGHWPLTTNHCLFNRQSSSWDRRLEQVLKITDLLLQSGGFGMVVVDLADVPPRFARRIPLASWFRFRRAVENTPTVLLVVEQEPYAKTCASLVLKMQPGVSGQSALGNEPSVFRSQHSAFSTQHSAFGQRGVRPEAPNRTWQGTSERVNFEP